MTRPAAFQPSHEGVAAAETATVATAAVELTVLPPQTLIVFAVNIVVSGVQCFAIFYAGPKTVSTFLISIYATLSLCWAQFGVIRKASRQEQAASLFLQDPVQYNIIEKAYRVSHTPDGECSGALLVAGCFRTQPALLCGGRWRRLALTTFPRACSCPCSGAPAPTAGRWKASRPKQLNRTSSVLMLVVKRKVPLIPGDRVPLPHAPLQMSLSGSKRTAPSGCGSRSDSNAEGLRRAMDTSLVVLIPLMGFFWWPAGSRR